MTGLAGALLLAGACLCMGGAAAGRLRARVRLLRQFEGALELMERELSYAGTEVPELLEKLSGPTEAGAFFRRCAGGLADPDRPPLLAGWDEDGTLTLYVPDEAGGFTQMRQFPSPRSDNWLYSELWDGLLLIRDDGTFFGAYDVESGDCVFYRNLDLGE